MFRPIKYFTAIIIVLTALNCVFAQSTGNLTGRVIDKENGEPIIGANIVLAPSKLGGVTDIEGSFTIRKVPEGTYEVKISFISYQTQVFKNVRIQSGKMTEIKTALEPATLNLSGIVITDRATLNFESALLN